MRVRRSPFDASAAGGGGGQGLTGAPTPSRPAANTGFQENNFDFDWAPSTTGPPPAGVPPGPGGARPQDPVLPPHARQPQGPQAGMQPQMQQHQQMPQQMPQQTQPGVQPQVGGQLGASLMQGAVSSMGFDGTVAGLVVNQTINQLENNIHISGLKGWFPNFYLSVQQLFNIGHSWVLRKLLLLLCPFIRRGQGAPSGPVWMQGGDSPDSRQSGSSVGPDGLKVDVEEPDLYIPSMSYVTYILVYGVQRGMLSDFRPEVLSATASFAFVLLILEVGAAKMGFYLAGNTVPVLHIMANCGYKYVAVCLMVIIRIVTGGNPIYYIFFAYLSACAAWATRRFMLHFEPSQLRQQYGVAPSKLQAHIILGVAIAQIPLCWLLTPSARGAKSTSAST
mmetsp:Transcript_101334/g.282036  ORF Transcript_101334/g.282036 Transcript_101334/m.282036 type:complete len:392 (-) Transcript_101334:271-1446(-)